MRRDKLSAEHPEIVNEITKELTQWSKDVNIKLSKNQNYAFRKLEKNFYNPFNYTGF
jgi:hypothetical protein